MGKNNSWSILTPSHGQDDVGVGDTHQCGEHVWLGCCQVRFTVLEGIHSSFREDDGTHVLHSIPRVHPHYVNTFQPHTFNWWAEYTNYSRFGGISAHLLIAHEKYRGLWWGDCVQSYPLVMTNIAMEHGPFIDDFSSYKPPFIKGFSLAMLNN